MYSSNATWGVGRWTNVWTDCASQEIGQCLDRLCQSGDGPMFGQTVPVGRWASVWTDYASREMGHCLDRLCQSKRNNINAYPHVHCSLYDVEDTDFPCTCHKGTQGEKRYSSTHSYLWHSKEVSGHIHAPATLPPANHARTHWIGGWLDPRDDQDVLNKNIISGTHRDSSSGLHSP
jgi:hypothetical protein